MEDDNNNIKHKAFAGVAWKFAEKILSQVIQVSVTILLARLLIPEDYGAVAIVSILMAFCNVIVTSGLATSLVQKKENDKLDYSTVLFACTVLATILYIILYICAPYIAKAYDMPILTPIFRVMGVVFYINGYKSVIYAYVSSTLQFKKFFSSTVIGNIVSGIIGIYMAYCGAGPWALVFQQISNALIKCVALTYVTRFKPSLVFSLQRFIPLFKYGWKILLSSLIGTIYAQIKPLIIGYKYSAQSLAYYTNGKQYPELLNTSISDTLSAVLFPVIAKFQDDRAKVLSVTSRYMRVSSYVIMPIIIGFFVVADNFVSVFLTDKWLPAVPYARIFCLVYLFDIIQVGNIQAIKAIGRSDVYLKLEIIKKIIYFIVIILFIVYSKSPIILASSEIVCTIVACTINIFPNKRLINYGYKKQIEDIAPNFLLSLAMAAIVYVVGFVHLDNYIVLLLQIVTGLISYTLLSILFDSENYIYLKSTLLRLRN